MSQVPHQFTGLGKGWDELVQRLEALDGNPKTEDAHDMMPRQTQQIDRGNAMGFKDADEILDPASIPYGPNSGDPRANESVKRPSRYK